MSLESPIIAQQIATAPGHQGLTLVHRFILGRGDAIGFSALLRALPDPQSALACTSTCLRNALHFAVGHPMAAEVVRVVLSAADRPRELLDARDIEGCTPRMLLDELLEDVQR